MADAPDTNALNSRYPSMANQPPEVERAADPKDAGRYWSMPGGAIPDRRVPRHLPADEPAAPAGQPDAETAKLRARFPTMFEADVRPTEADPAPAAEGDQAAAPPAPQDDAAGESGKAPSLPEVYRDLAPPEDLEINPTVFAAVAPDLQKLNLDRSQVEGLLKVYAGLQQREDAAVTAAQSAWRQEAAALPAAVLADARTLMQGAPPELARVLEASRLGDHAPTLRWLARLRAGGAAPVDDQIARRYPNTKWD